MPADIRIRPETPDDEAEIDALQADVFGPGRFARTAFRLREHVSHDPVLSLVAPGLEGLAGSVRLTPILIGDTAALLLGPLAVRAHLRGQGFGKTLMRAAMAGARQHRHALVLLVGDLPYYWPFGFRTVPAGRIVLPGPVDPTRLLLAELAPGAAEAAQGLARRWPDWQAAREAAAAVPRPAAPVV